MQTAVKLSPGETLATLCLMRRNLWMLVTVRGLVSLDFLFNHVADIGSSLIWNEVYHSCYSAEWLPREDPLLPSRFAY